MASIDYTLQARVSEGTVLFTVAVSDQEVARDCRSVHEAMSRLQPLVPGAVFVDSNRFTGTVDGLDLVYHGSGYIIGKGNTVVQTGYPVNNLGWNEATAFAGLHGTVVFRLLRPPPLTPDSPKGICEWDY